MRCPACSFENLHDGRYCTECGAAFVRLLAPTHLYSKVADGFISRVTFQYESAYPASERLELVGVGIRSADGGTVEAVEVSVPLNATGHRQTTSVNLSLERLRGDEPVLAWLEWKVRRGERVFPAERTQVWVALFPFVSAAFDLIAGSAIVLSPVTDFMAPVRIKLGTNSRIPFQGLIFQSQSLARIDGPPKRFIVRLPNGGHEVLTGGRSFTQSLDFKPIGDFLEGFRTGNAPPLKATHVLCGDDSGEPFEIALSGAAEVPFRLAAVPRIELGIWRSTRFGFACITKNRLLSESTAADEGQFLCSPALGSLMHDGTIERNKALRDNAIESELVALGNRHLRILAPIGGTRRRRFQVFLNYPRDEREDIGVHPHCCHIRVTPLQPQSDETGLTPDRVRYTSLLRGETVHLGELLSLGNIRDGAGFWLTVTVPDDIPADTEIDLRLELLRCRPDGQIIQFADPIPPVTLTIACYQRVINDFALAIDFGTSNTCVAGPRIDYSNPKPQEMADCYALDFYREGTAEGGHTTFATAVAYPRLEDSEPYIADVMQPSSSSRPVDHIYTGFKLELVEELQNAERFAGDQRRPTRLVADFITCVLERTELYYEDRRSRYTGFQIIAASSPVGFVPELKTSLEDAVLQRLRPRYAQIEFAFRIHEPLAVFLQAASGHLLGAAPSGPFLIGIVDIGGGTTDTAFILAESGKPLRLVGTGGSVYVGGLTFDAWLRYRLQRRPVEAETVSAAQLPMTRLSDVLTQEERKLSGGVERSLSNDIASLKHRLAPCAQPSPPPAPMVPLSPAAEMIGIPSREPNKAVIAARVAQVAERLIPEGSQWSAAEWDSPATVSWHLLYPFYSSLYEQLLRIIEDTMDECFANMDSETILPVPVTIVLAGNCSQIAGLPTLVEAVFNGLSKVQRIASLKIVAMPRPKESVALGTYAEAQGSIVRQPEPGLPPFCMYLRVDSAGFGVPLATLVDRQKDQWGIVIFPEGAFHNVPSSQKYLVRVFALQDILKRPTDTTVNVWLKIGIDDFSRRIKIIPIGPAPDRLAFVLDRHTRPWALAFSTPQINQPIDNMDIDLTELTRLMKEATAAMKNS